MDIETNRMHIRDFTQDDAGDLFEILGDAETMRFCEQAYTRKQSERFLREFCIGRKGAVAAAEKQSGKVIGYILFKTLSENVYEMGWFFNRAYWRRGYAYEACSKVIEYAFCVLGAHKINAETIDAVKSAGLMKKLGMVREGIQRSQTKDNDGNWADLHLYGMLKEDWKQER